MGLPERASARVPGSLASFPAPQAQVPAERFPRRVALLPEPIRVLPELRHSSRRIQPGQFPPLSYVLE